MVMSYQFHLITRCLSFEKIIMQIINEHRKHLVQNKKEILKFSYVRKPKALFYINENRKYQRRIQKHVKHLK